MHLVIPALFGLQWRVNGTGAVSVAAVGLNQVDLQVHLLLPLQGSDPPRAEQRGGKEAQKPKEAQAVEVLNPKTPPSTVFTDDFLSGADEAVLGDAIAAQPVEVRFAGI